MDLGTLRPHLLLMAFACCLQASAQSDGPSIGGPEGLDIYEELTEESGSETAVWDVNDSLINIPGYDMYCHWNTDVLFDRSGSHGLAYDDLRIELGSHECDIEIPCNGKVTSPFGMRRGRMHYGMDLDLETGDPVVAAWSGMVRISKYNKSFGNVVVIRHFNGLETLYAHLSKRQVEPGTLINAGDTLGLGGNTGRSYGSHLHFEVRFLDQPIDPSLVVDVEKGSLKTLHFDLNDDFFASKAAAASPTTSGTKKYHVVRRGDTLYGLSRKYGVRVRDLCRINGISERSILSLGQRLRYN